LDADRLFPGSILTFCARLLYVLSIGSLPADLYRLKNLTSVCMSVNALEGPLPPEWARCRQLTEVNLCSNKLSGKLPVKWSAPGALPAITGIYLQINKFTGKAL
jgi:hypothetical protein